MRRQTFLGAVSAMPVLAAFATLSAQGPAPSARPLTGPACSGCKIELRLVAELDGGEHGAQLENGAIRVVRVPTGEIFAAGWSGELYRFAASGKYVGLLGRKGEGPGEFRNPNAISLDRSGNLHILDPSLGRHSVFASSGKFLSASRYPPEFIARDFYVTADGEMVVAAAVRLPAAIGFPLHRIAHGQIATSFGPEVPIRPGTADEPVRYLLASAKAGGFWALKMTVLNLELRQDNGTLVRQYAGKRPWFHVTGKLGPVGPSEPLPPRLGGIIERDDGLLTVYGKVAGTKWTQAWGPPEPNPVKGSNLPATIRRIVDPDLAYDTYILVLDPSTGAILAERRFDQNVVEFADSRHVVTRSVVQEETILKVWQVEFTRPGGRR